MDCRLLFPGTSFRSQGVCFNKQRNADMSQGISTIRAPTNRPTAHVSRETLVRMATAGVKAVACISDLYARGSNLVIEVLRGSGDFTEWEHYPPDDVRDPKSNAQYYFHAHPPDERDHPDYGHFHLFMGPKGMPDGIRPAEVKANNDAPSHLIAISMTPAGLPERLFTTNHWVTGEAWYRAADVIAMLNRFVIDLDHPSRSLNDWLTAMVVLFRPQIEELLIERDRVILQWQADHSDTDVFEDRRLEIVSSIRISLHDQIEWLDRQLDAG
jgi:hypothetical protein